VKIRTKNFITLATTSLACSLTLSNLVQADHLAPESIVSIASAQSGSGTYLQAVQLVENYDRETRSQARRQNHSHVLGLVLSSSGSSSNLKQLVESRFEFGVVRADIAEAVYKRPRDYGIDLRIDHLRTIGKMSPSYVQIIARRNAQVKRSLDSLKGSNIGMGLPDEAIIHTVKTLFSNHGLPLESVNVFHQTLAESVRKLRTGQFDAMVIIDQLPNPLVDELMDEGDFELISLDSSKVDHFIANSANSANYAKHLRQIKGQVEAVVSLAINTLLVSKDTVPPHQIEPLLPYLHTTISAPSGRDISTDDAVKSPIIPAHDAVRAYSIRAARSLPQQADQQR